ncbi:hypothetical protein ANAPH2_01500 [Anaplasma phagocytophilum]|nr:hypothetical protein ANAPH2_01500 [Anaplasma phagocytophilum]
MLGKEKTCSGIGMLQCFLRSVCSFFCICIICGICDNDRITRKVLACEAIILSKVTAGNFSFSSYIFVTWLRPLAITNAATALFESL